MPLAMPGEDPTKPDPEIKVSDKRSFTREGDRRTPDQPKSEPVRPPSPPPAGEAGPGQGRGAEPPNIEFDSFIRYLGQVALQQMTGTRDPETGEVIGSLEEARQTIEILAMLKDKTRGNLTPRESKTLDDLLYHLQIEFSLRATPARR